MYNIILKSSKNFMSKIYGTRQDLRTNTLIDREEYCTLYR